MLACRIDRGTARPELSMKHELRVMQAQGSGSIINISSTYGHTPAPRAVPTRSPSSQPIATAATFDTNVLGTLVDRVIARFGRLDEAVNQIAHIVVVRTSARMNSASAPSSCGKSAAFFRSICVPPYVAEPYRIPIAMGNARIKALL